MKLSDKQIKKYGLSNDVHTPVFINMKDGKSEAYVLENDTIHGIESLDNVESIEIVYGWGEDETTPETWVKFVNLVKSGNEKQALGMLSTHNQLSVLGLIPDRMHKQPESKPMEQYTESVDVSVPDLKRKYNPIKFKTTIVVEYKLDEEDVSEIASKIADYAGVIPTQTDIREFVKYAATTLVEENINPEIEIISIDLAERILPDWLDTIDLSGRKEAEMKTIQKQVKRWREKQ